MLSDITVNKRNRACHGIGIAGHEPGIALPQSR
jgi:hypothetical protein